MSSKITRALPELVENGIITDEIAQNIKAYYATSEESSSNKLFTIFGILGATLVGLGIILIMAHNWDDFPKFIKLIFAFLPMLIGQAILGFSIFKEKSSAWKEAATAFLFFSVGACIALVSQIYNIPGNLASFLLFWVVLCLPLLYVTKSKTAVILHLVFITYYIWEEGFGFGKVSATPFIYIVLLGVSLPRYFGMIQSKMPSAVTNILHWLFPISFVFALPVYLEKGEEVILLMYMLLFGVFYNIGQLPYFKNKSLLQNGYRVIGSLGTVIMLLILSFKFLWQHAFRNLVFGNIEIVTIGVLFVISIALLYQNNKQSKPESNNLFQYTFLIFIMIFFLGFVDATIPTVLINILLFVLGIATIKIGVDKFHFGILNYGMLIITALIVCRFFDTNIPFELRGLLFVLVGVGFFAANYIMLKKQKTKNLKR